MLATLLVEMLAAYFLCTKVLSRQRKSSDPLRAPCRDKGRVGGEKEGPRGTRQGE